MGMSVLSCIADIRSPSFNMNGPPGADLLADLAECEDRQNKKKESLQNDLKGRKP